MPPIWRAVLSLFYPPVIIRGKNGKNSENPVGSNKSEKRKPKSAVYRSFWASVVYFHLRLISTKSHKREMTRNQFGSNATWVRIPPSAPKAAPYGALLFIFAANYTRAARWDSNSPCPALCVPPGCNSPADCCKGAGESHRLRQVSLLNSTLGSDSLLPLCKIPVLFL